MEKPNILDFMSKDIQDFGGYSKELERYVFHLESLQPTQFKVATEDSCVVLVEPNYTDALNDTSNLSQTGAHNKLMKAYDKAPSISKTELKLNKLRVENERLEKKWKHYRDMCKGFKETISIMQRDYTEANKQLNEQEKVFKSLMLTIGSKQADGQIIITNPNLFLKSWKREFDLSKRFICSFCKSDQTFLSEGGYVRTCLKCDKTSKLNKD